MGSPSCADLGLRKLGSGRWPRRSHSTLALHPRRKNGRQELFAIATDPHEEEDLFPGAEPELIDSLEMKIDAWLERTFTGENG